MKPLSPKTLAKKYAELGLEQEKADLLRKYFLCFSNLYGEISVREAWDIFRHYEGLSEVHKRNFVAFSEIIRREDGLPYSIVELRDVYKGETSEDPLDRLIINNRLIGRGQRKYLFVHWVNDNRMDKSYYLPEKKSELMEFTQDRFYETPAGKAMEQFIGNLKTCGKTDHDKLELFTVCGQPAKGMKLKDILCYTYSEQFLIEDAKREAEKELLRRNYKTYASEKVLEFIRRDIQTGGYAADGSIGELMKNAVFLLEAELGVKLSRKQFERFCFLYTELNNTSNLWCNCGWTPDALFFNALRRTPTGFSMPN